MIEEIFQKLRKEFLYKNNEKRIEQQQWLFEYYVGDKDAIIKYLDDALALTFDEDDIVEFQKDYINVTKKIINALSVVYKEPAVRYFAEEFSLSSSRLKGKFTEYYSSLTGSTNTIDKTINRYGNLFNTALTEVQFDVVTGKIRYINRSSHFYDVITDENNIYKPIEVRYQREMTLKGKPEVVTIVWTEKDHYGVTGLGNDFRIGDNKQGINPFGVIPFAVLRMEEQGDFWGCGQTDLVNGNEQINFLLTDLINGGVIMQAWGTPVVVNMQMNKKSVDTGVTETKRVRMGPKHPLVAEGVRKDMTQPSLEFKNANPLIREVMDVIDWKINKLAAIKGINPNTILLNIKDASGFSKIVDAVEQLELRRDSIEPCREYEKQRFEITKAVNNYYADTLIGRKFKLEKIPQDLSFVVDFSEIKMPITVGDRVVEDQYKLSNNIISVLDIARRDNPDLTDDQLMGIISNNKKINDELGIVRTPANVNNVNAQMTKTNIQKSGADTVM